MKRQGLQWPKLEALGFAGEALALSGNSPQAQLVAADLNKRFPEDTTVQQIYVPVIRAQVALNNHDPSTAIHILQTSVAYELGSGLYPAYVRGLAYLAANQGVEAGGEFQKILDHRGVVLNDPSGALAHLGLARAYALQGDTAKARAASKDFPHPLEGRRPRHSRPRRRQSRVRKAEIATLKFTLNTAQVR